MAEVYKIGPFIISYNLMIIFLSGIFSYATLFIALKKSEINRRLILDLFSSCILILIITWKFGGIILNPKLLISNPVLILFVPGNNLTLLLGFIISTGYIAFKIYKKVIPINTFLDSLSLSVLSFLFIYNLFTPVYGYQTRFPWGISLRSEMVAYHPIHIYFSITLVIIFIYLFKFVRRIGNGDLFMRTSLLVGISGLILTFLSPQINYIMGISQKQWIFIFLIITGSFLYSKQMKHD